METQNEVQGNKWLLIIGLPLAVVVPLLVVSFMIGSGSIYLWAGIGIGMIIYSFIDRKEEETEKGEEAE